MMPQLDHAAIAALRDACPLPVWYRRRTDNTGRKAGNIAEFVRRWGGRYASSSPRSGRVRISGTPMRRSGR